MSLQRRQHARETAGLQNIVVRGQPAIFPGRQFHCAVKIAIDTIGRLLAHVVQLRATLPILHEQFLCTVARATVQHYDFHVFA